MATKAPVQSRFLTRDQIAALFSDPRSRKAFENLISDASVTLPDATYTAQVTAEQAMQLAGQASMLAEAFMSESSDAVIPGPPGIAGSPGSAGPQGPAGTSIFLVEDGIDGESGPPGAAGAAGANGATGAQGPMGVAVFLEAEGEEGQMGPPGAAGITGSIGATGATGTQGPAGPAVFLDADAGEESTPLPPSGAPGGLVAGTAVLLSTQGSPGTPAAGQVQLFAESGAKHLTVIDDAGNSYTLGFAGITNFSASAQGPGFTTDTYVTGSAITIPASLRMRAGTRYVCRIFCNKNANGVAAPIATVRIGTTGTTSDTGVLTFTGAAQTAANDTGVITITVGVKSIGGLTGVVQGTFELRHNKNSGAGLSGTDCIEATSGSFNSTTASLIFGVSLNYGASVALTVTQVQAELVNI